MLDTRYGAFALNDNHFRSLALDGDVLSMGGSRDDVGGYFEIASRRSSIVRLPLRLDGSYESIADGQQPVVSADGKSLAFLREQPSEHTLWLCATDYKREPGAILRTTEPILEFTLADSRDLIVAIGPAGNPRLVRVHEAGALMEPLPIRGPARYPALSPDGSRLAFSRRKGGSWQLVVRDLGTGVERPLTDSMCNATQAFWEGDDSLLYATDCGRGLGLTALARISLPR